MAVPDRISFSLEFELNEPSPWWKDGLVGRALAEALTGAGLWLDYRFSGTAGGRLRKLRGPDELESLMRKWKPLEYVLQREPEYDADTTAVRLSLREALFSADVQLAGEDVASRADGLLDAFAAFGAALFPALAPKAVLTSGNTLLDDPYPRPRPPHVATLGFAPGSPLDLFDVEALRAQATRTQLDAVLKARLPPDSKRSRQGRLVTLRWAQGIRDAEALAAARARQEQWLIEHVGLDRDTSYNEAGDLRENASGASAHPPLTAYDRRIATGYKAVVPPAMDDEQWADIERWVRRRKLPDGSPLHALKLIVPNRELAVEVRGRALEAGVDAVLYTDNDGRWWDPFPPGTWWES